MGSNLCEWHRAQLTVSAKRLASHHLDRVVEHTVIVELDIALRLVGLITCRAEEARGDQVVPDFRREALRSVPPVNQLITGNLFREEPVEGSSALKAAMT